MKKPSYPTLCLSLYCGEYDTNSEVCRTCSERPALDAYHRQKEAYDAHQAREDHTGGSHPYYSPALAGWGGGDR
jgi:hypothetical protein